MVSPNIAFVGKAGSGKSTATSWMVEHFGCEKLSFAAPLKIMCDTTTDRDMLQRVGVGVRELIPDGWVNLLRDKLKHSADGYEWRPKVIDDCRFPNEYWALKAEGFVFVEVLADEDLRITRLRDIGKPCEGEQLQHESETALEGLVMDYTITNNGDMDDFFDEVRWVLECERKRA